jgi:hypothetical protein
MRFFQKHNMILLLTWINVAQNVIYNISIEVDKSGERVKIEIINEILI